jgi:trans-aconitate methyltransferase
MENSEALWNLKDYQKFLSSVPAAGKILIDLLQAKNGEKILDVGCGDGWLAQKIQLKGCHVMGIDSSPEMIKAAKERGLNAELINAQNITFENEFDAVFSHATLHWVKEAELAIQRMSNALKPGGRLVAEFGVMGNVSVIEYALIKAITNAGYEGRALNPWYHLPPEIYKNLLEKNGLEIELMKLTPCMVPLMDGMREWLQIFSKQFLIKIPLSQHDIIFDEAETIMRPILFDDKGIWHVDYVRLWVKAWKKPCLQ